MRRSLGPLLVLGALCPAAPLRAAESKVSLTLRPAVATRGAVHRPHHRSDRRRRLAHQRAPAEPEVPRSDEPDAHAARRGQRRRGELSEPRQSKTFAFAGDVKLLVYEGQAGPAHRGPGAGRLHAATRCRSRRRCATRRATTRPACRRPASRPSLSLPIRAPRPGAAGAAGGGAADCARRVGAGRGAQIADLLAQLRPAADARRRAAARSRAQPDALRLPADLGDDRLLRRPGARPRPHDAGWRRSTCSASPPSFSALGVAAALSGGIFGAALQQPAVVLFIVAVMIVPVAEQLRPLSAAAAGGGDALGRRQRAAAPPARCSWG